MRNEALADRTYKMQKAQKKESAFDQCKYE